MLRTTLTFCLTLTGLLHAAIVPAPFFSDHAILQRDVPLTIWGTASPNAKITIRYGRQTVATTTGADGNWQAALKPIATGTRGDMSFEGDGSLTLKDLAAGDVWFCSGQSNMQWTVRNSANSQKEIASAKDEDLRHFKIPLKPAETPQDHSFIGSPGWKKALPEHVGDFTAVGYYFARDLRSELGVPIGIIHSSWGGTAIEPWIASKSWQNHPQAAIYAEARLRQMENWEESQPQREKALIAWKQQSINAKAEGTKPPPQPRHHAPTKVAQNIPTQLYNGMVNPCIRFPIRGCIWYQGESNANGGSAGAAAYTAFKKHLVESWREAWNVGEFPFYFVQLANFNAKGGPDGRSWAFFREGQANAVAKVPNIGMACIIDVGEPADIHPRNKQAVGNRLARLALAGTHGKSIATEGPVLKNTHIAGKIIHLEFDDHGRGLISRGDTTGFEIAAKDGKFMAAEALLKGSTISLSAALVSEPAFVRYAWTNSPQPSLFDNEGLPVAPFRTDALEN